ncbi:hypothetical protein MiTa_04713 [Microcystis aeruginosa NIES-4264]|nr:hypothetical protein MiTa_04713 [Microcystis aeruginosa NIES-4264]
MKSSKGKDNASSLFGIKKIPCDIAFLIHKRYIPEPEQLNQQRFNCAAQMRETL